MKKTLLFVFVSATALLLIMSGCSKKNDSQAATMKNVAGTYKLTAYTGSFMGMNYNLMDSLETCQRDDNYKFNADSTYQYIDAGTQCSTSGNASGTWYINGNWIVLDGSDSATIKSFSGSQLVVTFTESSGGLTATATQTFTRL